MSKIKPAKKPAIKAAIDRGESVSMMEPLVLSQAAPGRAALADLAFELAQKSAGFRRSLPEALLPTIGNLVRSMNCYYSNLIEGHDTHPIDIERALAGDYSADAAKRDLQLEAKAHIEVQRWIDAGGLNGRAHATVSLLETHRRFCELLPADMLRVYDPATRRSIRVVPGAVRARDVIVGRHVPVSAAAVPRFLARFEAAYGALGKMETVLGAAAAHHRLAWIHPFLDGNGRVARLMSHASLHEALDTAGVWSVARGLARNVEAYKAHLAACDRRRRNDLDGRGNLSEESLADFTRFFLGTCLDQVSFMESLMQPARLRARVQVWCAEEIRLGALPQASGAILDALLYRGELPRGAAAGLLGMSERQASRIVSALLKSGALESPTSRAPLRLAFPARLAARWMPGLFPQ